MVMLTENGRLRQALEKAADAWPADSRRRFTAYNSLPFDRYRDLLAASQLMVRLGDDDAERPLLECMSCETLLMARADAAHFLRPGVNMLELPSHDPVGAVLAQLKACWRGGGASPAPQARMARRNVLAHFSEEAVVPAHLAKVMQVYNAWNRERGRA